MNPCAARPASPPDHHSLMESLVAGWEGGTGGVSRAGRDLE